MTSYCSWDSTVFLITIVTNSVLLVTAIICLIKFKQYLPTKFLTAKILCFTSMLLCIGIIVLGALFLPLKVSIIDKEICVTRMIGDVLIQTSNIQEIRTTNEFDTENAIRIFGSGGFWGFLGKFNSPLLGDYTMYVTNISKMITIKTKDYVFIISCDNPPEIIGNATKSKQK